MIPYLVRYGFEIDPAKLLHTGSPWDKTPYEKNAETLKEFLHKYFQISGFKMKPNTLQEDSDTEKYSDTEEDPDTEQDSDAEEVLDYSKWSMTLDDSIQAMHPEYGIEIVSPVFTSDCGTATKDFKGSWQAEISKMWHVIEEGFEVVTEYRHECGTHVHMSPLTGFKTEYIRKFVRYLVSCESEVTSHFPRERVESDFCLPNFVVKASTPPLRQVNSYRSRKELLNMVCTKHFRNSQRGDDRPKARGLEFQVYKSTQGD